MKFKYLPSVLIILSCIPISYLLFKDSPKAAETINEIFDFGDVQTFNYSFNNENFSFTKEGASWLLNSPFKGSANTDLINKINRIYTAPIYNHIKNTNPSEFGISTHNYIKTNNQTIYFGEKALDENYQYVMLDNKIVLINHIYLSSLLAGPTSWLSKHLLSNTKAITSITIDNNSFTTEKLKNTWLTTKADSLVKAERMNTNAKLHDILIKFENGSQVHYELVNANILVNKDYGIAYVIPQHIINTLLTP